MNYGAGRVLVNGIGNYGRRKGLAMAAGAAGIAIGGYSATKALVRGRNKKDTAFGMGAGIGLAGIGVLGTGAHRLATTAGRTELTNRLGGFATRAASAEGLGTGLAQRISHIDFNNLRRAAKSV